MKSLLMITATATVLASGIAMADPTACSTAGNVEQTIVQQAYFEKGNKPDVIHATAGSLANDSCHYDVSFHFFKAPQFNSGGLEGDISYLDYTNKVKGSGSIVKCHRQFLKTKFSYDCSLAFNAINPAK